MENPAKIYSPFVPLLLLLLFLGAGVGYQFWVLNGERIGVEARIQQVIPQADAALAAKKKLATLAVDVDQLAAKDSAATQIVNDFHIHVQNGDKAGPSSTSK